MCPEASHSKAPGQQHQSSIIQQQSLLREWRSRRAGPDRDKHREGAFYRYLKTRRKTSQKLWCWKKKVAEKSNLALSLWRCLLLILQILICKLNQRHSTQQWKHSLSFTVKSLPDSRWHLLLNAVTQHHQSMHTASVLLLFHFKESFLLERIPCVNREKKEPNSVI